MCLRVCFGPQQAFVQARKQARKKQARNACERNARNSASFFRSLLFFLGGKLCENALLQFCEGARKLAGFRLTAAAAGVVQQKWPLRSPSGNFYLTEAAGDLKGRFYLTEAAG
jgi:hypothetical protein